MLETYAFLNSTDIDSDEMLRKRFGTEKTIHVTKWGFDLEYNLQFDLIE